MSTAIDDQQYKTDLESKDPNFVDVEEVEDDSSYTELTGWKKFYRGTLFQMIILGALSFCGPSMSDAISGLGGGGLATPYLSNLATSLGYATSAIVAFVGGPLINRLGIKTSCILAALCFPLSGTGYYVNLVYGVEGYLVFAKAFNGIFAAFLYVAEGTAMISYPLPNQRGLFLSIWVGMRNAGSMVGGIISLANNIKNKGAGAVSRSTYGCFIAFECAGVFTAFLLSHQTRVRRKDGSKVANVERLPWKTEFKMLGRHLALKRTLFMIIPYAYSFFYGGVFSTYLSLHFSVRARALSAFITPLSCILSTGVYGVLLDWRRFSQKTRGYYGFALWAVPQAACMIWLGIEMKWFGERASTLRLDWSAQHWAVAYLPYLVVQFTGYWCQTWMYWLLGAYSTDTAANARSGGLFRSFETMGQAISYGINSSTGNKFIPLYINAALLVVTIPCSLLVTSWIPTIPSEVDEVEDNTE